MYDSEARPFRAGLLWMKAFRRECQVAEDVILDIAQVSKEFPGVTALKDVSIQVKRGEIHGLCGENGAGKSTLMKILCGVYPFGTYQGSIRYDGKELKLGSDSIHEAMEQGIAIVYQEMTLVPKLTVGENIFLGKEPRTRSGHRLGQALRDTAAVLKKHKLPISRSTWSRTGGRPDADDRDRQGPCGEREGPHPRRADLRPLQGRGRPAHGDPPDLKAQGVTCLYISTSWRSSSASPTPCQCSATARSPRRGFPAGP